MEPIEFGAVRVFPFGLVLALALGGCVLWSLKSARGGAEKRCTEIFWLIALPLGLLLAHAGYCLDSLDMIGDMLGETLIDLAGGGYLFYGALAGAAIALSIACRRTGTGFAAAADRLAGPFLLFGAACALGEGLIGAGTGWKVEDWFLAENSMSLLGSEEPGKLTVFFSRFPFALRDAFYGYAAWAVFLPMALFLLAGLLILRGMKEGQPGNRAVFALSWYAAGRILYESMRQDDIPKWGFVRPNQIFSAVLLLILLLICWRKAGRGRGGSLLLFLGGVVLCGAMEFALEKKIGFLEWMTMDVCYAVSCIGCALLFRSTDRLRRMALSKGNPARKGTNR